MMDRVIWGGKKKPEAVALGSLPSCLAYIIDTVMRSRVGRTSERRNNMGKDKSHSK